MVDVREKDDKIVEMISKEGAELAGKYEFDVGDYGFVGGTWFERKSFDFINFGHLIDQAEEMVLTYPHPYIIVDTPLSTLIAIISKRMGRPYAQLQSQIIGVIASLASRGVAPIFCPDKSTMARVMVEIAKKNIDTKSREINKLQGIRFASHDDYLTAIYLNLPGVGRKLAGELKAKYPNLKSLVNTNIDDLTSIPKIGQTKAKKILEVINGVIEQNI